jgi:hypothetical protein
VAGGHEGIDEVRTITPAELYTMIRDGTVNDSFALAACAFAVARGRW